jgi:hypothetical protein
MVGDSWARWAHSIGCFDGPSRSVPFGPTRRPALGLGLWVVDVGPWGRRRVWPGGGARWQQQLAILRSNKAALTKEIGGLAAGDGASGGPSLTSEQIWRELARASFAVLAYVTPRGEPRSSGVVYKVVGRRLYIAVAPDSLKARHIAPSRKVSVTVPKRRGGVLSLVAPIPPATVSFRATIAHPAGSPETRSALQELGGLGTARAADIRQRPRSHSRGHLSDVRRGRIAEEDVGADRRSRRRRGRVIAGGRK